MQLVMLAVASRQLETTTDTNKNGFQHLKIQATKCLTHPISRGFCKNWAIYKKQKNNPQNDEESRQNFSNQFDWKDSMLQQHEINRIEMLLVEFNDVFARHMFDIGMNEEFAVKLTPNDDSPVDCQSLLTPVNLREDILVELALLRNNGIITTLPFSKYVSYIFAQKNLTENIRLLLEIINLISSDYTINNNPVSILTDAAHHMAGKQTVLSTKWPTKD